jgi:hypothetical protein
MKRARAVLTRADAEDRHCRHLFYSLVFRRFSEKVNETAGDSQAERAVVFLLSIRLRAVHRSAGRRLVEDLSSVKFYDPNPDPEPAGI